MGGPGSGRKKGSKNRVKSGSDQGKISRGGGIRSAKGGASKAKLGGVKTKGMVSKGSFASTRKLAGKNMKESKFGKSYKSDYKFA
jgi:hypothetical protein